VDIQNGKKMSGEKKSGPARKPTKDAIRPTRSPGTHASKTGTPASRSSINQTPATGSGSRTPPKKPSKK